MIRFGEENDRGGKEWRDTEKCEGLETYKQRKLKGRKY